MLGSPHTVQIVRGQVWPLIGEYGVIVASDIGQKLRYAATQVPNVRLMEYDLKVDLRAVTLR